MRKLGPTKGRQKQARKQVTARMRSNLRRLKEIDDRAVAKWTRQLAADASRRSQDSMRRRLARLSAGLGPIVQTATAAAVAWYLGVELLGHQKPIFAAVAAVITLSATRNEHWRRAIEMVLGVALGIAVSDLLLLAIGTGPLQIAFITILAMSAALFLGAGATLVTQAGVSAILVATVERFSPGLVSERFIETLVGGGVALIVSHLMLPLNPILAVAKAARPVFRQLAEALEETSAGLARGDPVLAERGLSRARAIDTHVRLFYEALAAGYEIARFAPPRRRAIPRLDIYAQAANEVDFAVRDSRVLARNAIKMVQDGRPAPPELSQAVLELARGVRSLGEQLESPERRDNTRMSALKAVTYATFVLDDPELLTTSLIVGQVQSTALDLLRAAGIDLTSAQQALEEAEQLVGEQG